MTSPNPPFTHALCAGALAGTTVDMALFPLDTLKTRLQSSSGFLASGGFRGIYQGVGSALVGSAPGAAFFFCTYEATKSFLAHSSLLSQTGAVFPVTDRTNGKGGAIHHMLAASLGEIAACAVRVPTEVVKQRAQAGQHAGSSAAALRAILALRGQVGVTGVARELYRGWGITVVREVPFTVIQFPLWEAMKSWGRERRKQHREAGELLYSPAPATPVRKEVVSQEQGALLSPREFEEDVPAFESALYGSAAGAVAAAITTPLDVLKTRVMLSRERTSVVALVRGILREHGIKPFFAGIGPRVMWISIGGAIFLGSYQWAVNTLQWKRRES